MLSTVRFRFTIDNGSIRLKLELCCSTGFNSESMSQIQVIRLRHRIMDGSPLFKNTLIFSTNAGFHKLYQYYEFVKQ